MANEAEWKECFDLFDKAHSAHCTGLKHVETKRRCGHWMPLVRVPFSGCEAAVGTLAHVQQDSDGKIKATWPNLLFVHGWQSHKVAGSIQKIFRRYSEDIYSEVQQSKTEMQKQRMIGG